MTREREIEQSIRLILGTSIGERPMRPDFGCRIHDHVFGPANSATAGQIAEGVSSETLERVARISSWAMPFEALYQTSLSAITADTRGFTRFAIQLGPFGGAQSFGGFLVPYTVLYLAAVGGLALVAFRRRDL